MVDMVMMESYANQDLNEEPVLLLPCGHMLGWTSLDQIMHLPEAYEMDSSGEIKLPCCTLIDV